MGDWESPSYRRRRRRVTLARRAVMIVYFAGAGFLIANGIIFDRVSLVLAALAMGVWLLPFL